MRTKILSVVLFFTFFTIGCELIQQNEYYHLSSEYRSLLKTGDTLVYIDSKSETDTFLVFRKISGTYRVALSGSSCKVDPSAYFDLELLYLQRKNDKVLNARCNSLDENTKFGSCEGSYYCDETILLKLSATDGGKIMAKNGTIPFLTWNGYSLHRSDSLINTMTVLNDNYNNVFYYKSDNIQKTDSIQEIFYSYQYGIIQMNLLNGNILKLMKK